jgi:hypothetical protein
MSSPIFSPAAASPRMPCSGARRATSFRSLCCAIRSMSEVLDRSIPVWLVMRPTRLPRSLAGRSARNTSMPGLIAPGASADCGASIEPEPAGDGGAEAGVCAHEASRKRTTQSSTAWLPLQPRHDGTRPRRMSADRGSIPGTSATESRRIPVVASWTRSTATSPPPRTPSGAPLHSLVTPVALPLRWAGPLKGRTSAGADRSLEPRP